MPVQPFDVGASDEIFGLMLWLPGSCCFLIGNHDAECANGFVPPCLLSAESSGGKMFRKGSETDEVMNAREVMQGTRLPGQSWLIIKVRLHGREVHGISAAHGGLLLAKSETLLRSGLSYAK
jgi:hypothetical protein